MNKAIAVFLVFMSCSTAIAQAAEQSSTVQQSSQSEKILYHFCEGGAAGGCVYPGKGYTVCERFLKMLNEYGAQENPLACEVSLHPDYPEFSKPDWQELDIHNNLKLVYQLDLNHFRNATGNETRRTLTFEQWKKVFEGEIEAGQSKPLLRRTLLKSSDGKTVTLLAYRRIDRCSQEVNKREYVFPTGWLLFVYDESSGQIDKGEFNSLFDFQRDVIKYQNKYLLVEGSSSPGARRAYADVYIVEFVKKDGWPGLTVDYPARRQCEMRADWSKVSSQESGK